MKNRSLITNSAYGLLILGGIFIAFIITSVLISGSWSKTPEIVQIWGSFIRSIDEIPIIIIASSVANGPTLIKNAEELRFKETDRLLAMSKFLEISKIKHQLNKDGMKIFGDSKFIGGEFDSFDDHRIAMSIAISSIVAKNNTIINDHEVASISYKNFYNHLELLKT